MNNILVKFYKSYNCIWKITRIVTNLYYTFEDIKSTLSLNTKITRIKVKIGVKFKINYGFSCLNLHTLWHNKLLTSEPV